MSPALTRWPQPPRVTEPPEREVAVCSLLSVSGDLSSLFRGSHTRQHVSACVVYLSVRSRMCVVSIMYVHVRVPARLHVYLFLCLCLRVCMSMCLLVFTRVCLCVCVSVSVLVYLHLCVYL